jgi:mediator of RNA polymerase II transcription subunit 14
MSNEHALADYNPHEDAEPFLRNVLGRGDLGPSLQRLVVLLRDTLPIASVLDEIRAEANNADGGKGRGPDCFAKSAGWYRLMYSDLRFVCSLSFPSVGGNLH